MFIPYLYTISWANEKVKIRKINMFLAKKLKALDFTLQNNRRIVQVRNKLK